MPRLIFVNGFFFPDHSATSQILSDLAFHLAGKDLAEKGRDVHVVTDTQIYDDPKASLPDHEIVNGVHVHRVSSTRFGRTALLGRSIDYLSFYRSVRARLIEIARPGDIIIAKTDHRSLPSWPWRPQTAAAPAWSIGCKTSIRKPPWFWTCP